MLIKQLHTIAQSFIKESRLRSKTVSLERRKAAELAADKKMSEHKLGMLAGMAAGLLVGLIVAAVIMKLTKINGRMKCEYDERQSVIRGNGYKYGFFAFMICNFLHGMSYAAEINLLLDPAAFAVLSIIIALAVQISYCIWNDAYFSMNENKTRVLIVFAIIGIVNLAIGIFGLCDGRAIENGVLNFRCTNLFCGVLFLYIFGVLFLKRFAGSEDGEE